MSYYRRSLTVDHTKVPSNQTDFSVLVSATDATFKTTGSGGHVQNANGYDIGFYADSAGTTKLKWEMETYDGSAGTVVAWVKIASLSSSVDTVFYMFYGNPSITTDQSDPPNTWDANFKDVWHMSDNAANTTIHATVGTNATNLVNTNINSVAGQISNALFYGGVTDASSAAVDLSSSPVITLSFWMFWFTNANDDRLAFEYTNNYNNKHGFIVDWNASGGVFDFGTSDGAPYWTDSFTRPTDNTWHLIHLVMDKTTPINKAYVDGSSKSLTSANHSASPGGSFDNSTLYFMSRGTTSLFGSGYLDEVHVSTMERSADWITAEFNNQFAPGTFITVGSETPFSAVQQRRTLSALGTRIGSRQLQEA